MPHSDCSVEGESVIAKQRTALLQIRQEGEIEIGDKDFNLTNCEEFDYHGPGTNTYRKSEILRYAEEEGFDNIDRELSDPDGEFTDEKNSRESKDLLARQEVINNIFKKYHHITLQDEDGVRATFMFRDELQQDQINTLLVNIDPDFMLYRGHGPDTEDAIHEDKSAIPANTCMVDGGCSGAYDIADYEMVNQFMAYTGTGKGLSTLYVTDAIVDMMRKNRKHLQKGNTDDMITNRSAFANEYFTSERGEEHYGGFVEREIPDYLAGNLKMPGFEVAKIHHAIAQYQRLQEAIDEHEEITSLDDLVEENNFLSNDNPDVIDSNLTVMDALGWHALFQMDEDSIEKLLNQRMTTVKYFGFDDKLHQGQIIAHKDQIQNVQKFFNKAVGLNFPIAKVTPVSLYKGNDNASMNDNNSSGFNYRKTTSGYGLSKHAGGNAIDINPVQNPYEDREGNILPVNADRDNAAKGKLTKQHELVKYATDTLNWERGGTRDPPDYQHFQW